MKNTIIFVMSLVLCMAVATVFAGESHVAKMLPGNTECMVKIGSVKKLFDSLAVTETSVMGRQVKNLESLKTLFGFNPLSIKELTANGFDTGREAGIVIDGIALKEEAGQRPEYGISLMLPASDSKKAAQAIQTFLKNDTPETQFKTEGKITTFHRPGEAGNGYLAEKGKYMVLGFNETTGMKPSMKSLMAGITSLPKTGNYKDVAKKLDAGSDVFAYFNVAKIVGNNLDMLKNMSEAKPPEGQAGGDGPVQSLQSIENKLEIFKDFEGVGIAFNFGNTDFHAKSVLNMVPGSKTVAVANGSKFNKKIVLGIDEPAMFLLTSAFNMEEYGHTITETDAKIMNNLITTMQTEYGIDFDKEINGNLEGNFNIAVYDGMSLNMTNLNLVMTIGIKNEADMIGVIEKAVANLPPEKKQMIQKRQLANHDAYVANMGGLTQLYIGVKDKNLIIAAGKGLFEKAVKADLAQGFVGKLTDKKLKAQLGDDAGMLYLNFGEVFAAVSNILPMFMPTDQDGQPKPLDAKFGQAAEKFKYLLTTSRPKGNALHFDLSIKTEFAQPFFKGVADILKSFEAKPETEG